MLIAPLPGWALRTWYWLGLPKASKVIPSMPLSRLDFDRGVVTWSASMSLRSSLMGESRLSLLNRTAKASPSCVRACRMVRSLPGRSTALAQAANSRSMVWLASSASVSIWSRGPVPMTSLASVRTMPRA